MEDFNDTSFEQLPLDAKRRIDAICARFEEAWSAGRPRLADFLAGVAAEPQAAETSSERIVLLAELLHIDIERRRSIGEHPVAADYLAQFPRREAIIRQVLPQAPPPPVQGETIHPNETAPPEPNAQVHGIQAPGYVVLEELGRGGMGIVYKALHLALNRMVALKFVLTGIQAPPRRRVRFRREAEVIARLRHPNIVQIYDIGEIDGQCFLALEYADAGSLRQRLNGSPMSPRAAASLLEPLARAVQHAHRQGIVHRDLKPANILLSSGGDSVALGNRQLPDRQLLQTVQTLAPELLPPLTVCTPKLTDFGLARILEEQPGSESGFAAGTPSYMAPEQARGEAECGPSVDIWAMGVTLYELLTGRPPFRAATALDTINLVQDADPVPPRQLQPGIPVELEAICLKCLEKDPGQRYAGARELASDLRSFLDGRPPVHARPDGRLARAFRRARKHPKTAGVLVVCVACLLGGVFLLAAQLWNVCGQRDAALEALAQQGRQAATDSQQAEQANRHAQAMARHAAELYLRRGSTLASEGRVAEGMHAFLAGLRIVPTEASELEHTLRVNLAGWRPRLPTLESCVPLDDERPNRLVAISGKRAVWMGSSDGRLLRQEFTGDGLIRQYRIGTRAIAFLSLRDETRILVGNGKSASYFLPATGNRIDLVGTADLPAMTDGVLVSDEALTAGVDGVVRRWDALGRLKKETLEQALPLSRLAISPDQRQLACIRNNTTGTGGVGIWDLRLARPPLLELPHPASVTALVFHPDGNTLWTGCEDGVVRCWNAQGKLSGESLRHSSAIDSLAFTSDGRMLVVGQRDHLAVVRERVSGAVVARLRAETPGPVLLAGGRLLAVDHGEFRIYRLPQPGGHLPKVQNSPQGGTRPLVAIAPDGDHLLVVDQGPPPHAQTYRLDTGTKTAEPWRPDLLETSCAAFSPDGKVVYLAGLRGDQAGGVLALDADTGKPTRPVLSTPSPVRVLTISNDGQQLLFADATHLMRWHLDGEEKRVNLPEEDLRVTALAVSPDRQFLACAFCSRENQGLGELRRLTDLALVPGTRWTQPGRMDRLEFAADGKSILASGANSQVWKVGHHETRSPLFPTRIASFARRGELILTADDPIRSWKLGPASASPAAETIDHPGATALLSSADGQRVLIGDRFGGVRLWRVEGWPLGPAVSLSASIATLWISPDARAFAAAATNGTGRRWQVAPPVSGSVGGLERELERLTGWRASGAGLVPLDRASWQAIRIEQTLFPPGPGEDLERVHKQGK